MLKIDRTFSNLELDVFLIMPKDMHGIIALNDISAPTIGYILGAYKSLVAYACLDIFK